MPGRCKDGYEETGGRCVPAAARRSPAAVAAGGRGTDAGRGGGAGEYDALCQQQFGEFAEFDGVDSCRCERERERERERGRERGRERERARERPLSFRSTRRLVPVCSGVCVCACARACACRCADGYPVLLVT